MLNQTFARNERTKLTATAIGVIAAIGLGAAAPALATEPAVTPQAAEQRAPAPSPANPAAEAPAAKPAEPRRPETGTDAAAPAETALIGLPVMSSDGKKVGSIEKVISAEDGKVTEMIVETSGFFGLGAKRIAVPAEQVTTGGDSVRLALTASDFNRLPEVATSGRG